MYGSETEIQYAFRSRVGFFELHSFLNLIKQMPAIHESTRIKKNDEEPRNQLPSKKEKEITMNHCCQHRIRMINENLTMQGNDGPMCDLRINELNKS